MLSLTYKAIGQQKTLKTKSILGYGPSELMEHLSNHPDWPLLKDRKWHIDHIFPIKAFLDNGITDVSLINALSNLQPSSPEANLLKGAKYDQEKFTCWLKSTLS